MPVRRHSPRILWTAVGLLTSPSMLTATAAFVCSKSPVPRARHAQHVHFIGRALRDTVLAGPGSIRYTTGAGHSGRGQERAIYGQLVQADQVGQPWKGLLPPDAREVVLVPWDYAPDCHSIVWGLSAQWIPPGTEGLYRGQLRDTSDWVDGRPTLDVHSPEFVPYPVARRLQRDPPWKWGAAGDTAVPLTPTEALEFFGALPTADSLRNAPAAALRPLEEWAASHPAQPERWPAHDILRGLRREAEDNAVRLQPSPVAGTYRFVVVGDGGDSVVFYARTAERPTSTLRAVRRGDHDPGWPIVGYYLTTRWAPTLSELSDVPAPSQGQYYAVGVTAVQENADSTVWRGHAYVEQPANAVARSQTMRLAIAALNAPDPKFYYVPGFWITFPDGRVRFERKAERDGRAMVTVRAERISLDVLRLRH